MSPDSQHAEILTSEAQTEIECIRDNSHILAYIVRATFSPAKTTFITPPELSQQIGFIVYGAGTQIPRHTHRRHERHLVGTTEVLLVQKGQCEVDLYSEDHSYVTSRTLRTGDLIFLVAGGHGFRVSDAVVLLEIKQGPYSGLDEKERF